jgi:hypothetical protein
MISTKKPLHPLGENTKDNQGIKALQKVNKTVLKATLNCQVSPRCSLYFECTIAIKDWEVLINGIRQTQCVNGMCSSK